MSGVTPEGFVKLSFQQVKADLEAAMVAALGANLDLSLDTPQGQIINIVADAQATMWELAQDVYSSIDIRQAQGARLDQLGGIRGTVRKLDETDAQYRERLLRQRNPTQTAVDALEAAVSRVTDVESVVVQYNATGFTSSANQQALTAYVEVTGGDDMEVAQAISDNLVFGLGLLGNRVIALDAGNGLSRTIRFVRPTYTDVTIKVIAGVGQDVATELVRSLITERFNERQSRSGIAVSADYYRAVLIASGIPVDRVELNDVADAVVTLQPFERGRLVEVQVV